MKFCILTEQQFNEFASKHPLSNFHQCSNWGKVKADNGWKYEFVGVEDENGLCGAALLLSKSLAKVFKMFYSPRGFLLDYSNEEVVNFFIDNVKQHVKKNKGIVLKIDPYIDEQELDLDGIVVEGGYDYRYVKDVLVKNGFKFLTREDGSKKTTMVNSIFVLDFNQKSNDELFAEFSKHVKQSIKGAIKYGVQVEELTYDQLPRFKAILERTGKRRGFVDRPLSYYQSMYKMFAEDGYMKFCIATLDMNVYKATLSERYEKAVKTYERLLARKQEKPESTRFDGELKEAKVNLDSSKKRLDEVEEVIAKYGQKVDLSCACYFMWGTEVLNLYGGNEEELLKYGGQYYLHWNMIQYANNNGYARYNFYGIPNDLNKENNPMYGVYEIKRGFHGHVIRLLGEFDLIINPLMYNLYEFALRTYKKIRP